MGEMVVEDLEKHVHIFVGGSTNSGKSTALNNVILSIIKKQTPNDVNLLIFDFGITYLREFKNIPHLSHPVITDMRVGYNVIRALKAEAERRRELYHNNRSEFDKLPTVFCIIDEFHAFIQHGGKDVQNELKKTIKNLLETSRDLKIKMILAAQDPTEKNVPIGVTNVGTIMAFRCGREHNSRVMIGESGAEKLLGKGDMLFKSECHEEIRNIQSAYMAEKDISEAVGNLDCSQPNENKFVIDESETQVIPSNSDNTKDKKLSKVSIKESDENMAEVIVLLLKDGEISNSKIQGIFGIGYPKANKYMNKLEELGLIRQTEQRKSRNLIPKKVEDVDHNVLELLKNYGYTKDKIKSLIDTHSTNLV